MLIFLYGSDGYRLKQAKEEYINRYKAKYPSGVNLFSFDFSVISDINGLDDALRISSFFNEHKLLLCYGLFNNKTTAEKIFSLLKSWRINEDQDVTVLIVESLPEKDLIAKNKELFNYLSDKKNTIKIIRPLEGADLAKWVKSEFQSRECQIQNEVIKKLIDVVGTSSWDLTNEINKLANYSSRGEVKMEYINLLASKSPELNIFDLIDTVAQKNKPKAFGLLYKELKSTRDPYYILTMIIYQFRNLLMVKGLQEQGLSQSDIAKKAKLHPFVVKKTETQIKSFQIDELKTKYKKLLEADINAKKGDNKLENYLYNFILN